jgi:hypothetical protein
MAKLNWEKANLYKKVAQPDKELQERKKKAPQGMPKAGPVKVTKADGSVEVLPSYRGGSTKNIGIYKK